MGKVSRISLTAALVLTLGIASILGAYSIVNAATGGPDAYGYYYIDSNEGGGPSYSFADISGTGTALVLSDDDNAYPVPIGFSFDFYGVSYTDISVCSNGGLTFGDWGIDFINYDLPYYTEPFIAVFWDDLNPESGGAIYYETLGTAPNRTFVVEWYDIPHYSNTGDSTFEVILYEGSNEILMQYADTDFGNTSYDWGQSATVGIQQDDSTALKYSYNSPDITNPLAILFYIGLQGGGTDKNTYRTTEDVTFHADGFPPGSDVDVYVVEDFTWNDSDSIPPVPSTVFAFNYFTANINGEISGTIWDAPLERGEYDIVFDAGQDGTYDEIPDLVDDPNHPGFTVVSGAVGGEVYPIDKAALLLPWLGLSIIMTLAAGGLVIVKRQAR